MSLLINELIDLLKSILNLETISNNENTLSIDVLLTKLLTEYDKACNSIYVTEYVELWLITYFDISYKTDNFIMSNVKNWQDLFDSLKVIESIDVENDMTQILISQLILSLCEISIINFQKLAISSELRSILQTCIFDSKFTDDSRNSVPIQIKNMIKIYSLLLAVTCSTIDIMSIINTLPSNIAFMIFDNICCNMNNLSLVNQIIFENTHHHIKFQNDVDPQTKNITIQLWVELNNTTHQRMLTLDTDLIIEIQNGKLCLRNEEFILGVFDNVDFESHHLYQISLSYICNKNKWILYVNDELKQCFTIYSSRIPIISSVELGSPSCSFRLYSLNIWSLEMTSDMVKVTYQLGPAYKPTISSNDQCWGLLRNFPQGYLETLYFLTESTYLAFEEFQQHIKNLTLENLLFYYDLEDTIQQFGKANPPFHLTFPYGNESSLAKTYFLYTENIQAKLITVNIFKVIIFQLQLTKSPDLIFQYTSLILDLCKDPTLLLFFQKSVGFDLLAHILYQTYVKNYQKGLSIEFLHLFLQFCGWNDENIELSMLRNSNAYQHLILNFDLWIYPCKIQNNKNIELVRYIFFHLSMLQDSNKYREYNGIELKKIYVFPTICYFLYVNENEMFNELTDSLVSTLYTLVINDSSRMNYNLIWQIIIISLENDKLYNIELFINVLDRVLNHTQTLKNHSFFNILSVDLLLYVASHMSHKHLRITALVKLLLQQFSLDERLYKKFLVQNGIRLLFSFLTRYHVDSLFDILPILFSFATSRDMHGSLGTDNFHDYHSIDFGSRLPFVYLSLDLAEWMVYNSKQMSPKKDFPEFLNIFVEEIITYIDSLKNRIINKLKLLPYLSSLLFTLVNLDSPETYQDISKRLVNFLSNLVIGIVKCKQDTEIQLSILWGYESYFDNEYLKTYEIQDCNFIDLIFVESILPHVLSELLSNELSLMSELEENTVMIKNIFDLLNGLNNYLVLITYNPVIIRQVYELLFVCGEVVLSMNPASTNLVSRYSMLLSNFSKNYCRMVLNKDLNDWSNSDREIFDSNLVKYQSSIYGSNSQKNIHDVTQYLLFALLYRLCLGESSKMLIPAIRTLLVFNYENLGDLIVKPYQNCEFLKIYLGNFLSSNDEVILDNISTMSDSILNECVTSFYQKEANSYANRWFYTNPITKDGSNELILERKHCYANFNKLESEKLNKLLIECVKRKTKVVNDNILKKFNNYFIETQECKKTQENRKSQINFEIRHLRDIWDKKRLNNMTICNEENSERMRHKVVPW